MGWILSDHMLTHCHFPLFFQHNNWGSGVAEGDSWIWWLLIILGKLTPGVLCSMEYLFETHLKAKSLENSLAYILFLNNPIVLKFCSEHGSITFMLCAKFQNDWMTETDFMDKQNFARLELNSLRPSDAYMCRWTQFLPQDVAFSIHLSDNRFSARPLATTVVSPPRKWAPWVDISTPQSASARFFAKCPIPAYALYIPSLNSWQLTDVDGSAVKWLIRTVVDPLLKIYWHSVG